MSCEEGSRFSRHAREAPKVCACSCYRSTHRFLHRHPATITLPAGPSHAVRLKLKLLSFSRSPKDHLSLVIIPLPVNNSLHDPVKSKSFAIMGLSGHASGEAVIGVTVALTILAAIAVSARLFARLAVVHNAGLDDGFIFAALLLSIATTITICLQGTFQSSMNTFMV